MEQRLAVDPVRVEVKAKHVRELLKATTAVKEEVTMNSRCFKILRLYSNSLNLSNAGETTR